jgi:hypothetical protein
MFDVRRFLISFSITPAVFFTAGWADTLIRPETRNLSPPPFLTPETFQPLTQNPSYETTFKSVCPIE